MNHRPSAHRRAPCLSFCERKGLAQDAGAYNELVTSWGDILAASTEFRADAPQPQRPNLPGERPGAPGAPAYRHYWAKADLDPFNPVSRVDLIARELLSLLNARPGVRVKVSLDIEADGDAPFPPDLVRAVKENAAPGNLALDASEFS